MNFYLYRRIDTCNSEEIINSVEENKLTKIKEGVTAKQATL